MMKHAKLYSSVNDIPRRRAQELLNKYGKTIRQEWDRNTKILDVGCGDGSVTNLLMNQLPPAQWSACDISPDMLKFARKTYGKLGVDFFYMDIRNEVKEELRARFDRVFCLLVLHRIQNQRVALSNIHSLIKPNGRCLVSIVSKSEIYDMDRLLAKNPKWSPYISDVEQLIPPYNRVENPEEYLKELMTMCGFRDIHVCTKNMTSLPDETGKKYRNLVKSVDPCLSMIPLDLHEEYMDDYFQLMADWRYKPPTFETGYSILEAIAHK